MKWKIKCFCLASLAVAGLTPLDVVHAQPSLALIEARRHMLDAEINTLTFRSMEKLFDTLRVANEGPPWRLVLPERASSFHPMEALTADE